MTQNAFFRLLKEIKYRYQKHNISALSAQLSFFLILSLFPFLIVIFSLFGTFSLDQNLLMKIILSILPKDSGLVISNYMEEIVLFESVSYVPIFVLGTLIAASRGVDALRRAMNVAYLVSTPIRYWKQKLYGILYTVLILAFIVTLTLLSVAGSEVLKFVSQFLPISVTFMKKFALIRWIVIPLVILSLVSLIFLVLPSKKIKIKNILPGAIFSVLSWSGMSVGFSYFVSNIANYTLVYGSLAALMILMLWLYLTGILLILGAEINSIFLEGEIRGSSLSSDLKNH